MQLLDLVYNIFRPLYILFSSFFVIFILINLINDSLNPFFEGNKPENKYFNIIQYKPVPCLYCDKYVDKFYKRTIFGISFWNGGVHCDAC